MSVQKIQYHKFRIKEVVIDHPKFTIKYEEHHDHDEYQGDYKIECSRSGNVALNNKIFGLVQDMQAFVSSQEDNVRMTKIKVSDFGDTFDTVQMDYETDLESEKPTKVKEPKREMYQFGGLQDDLSKKLEEIKLNAFEYVIKGLFFRPTKTKAEITDNGEIVL